jgi:EAL domain-containing protein (putative c-di-GMP-specific phosphodiesterase class I)/GGDEF domain-containing protein
MSLFRQLWIAVIAATLIAFAGSLIVSMITARQYVEQQLAIKNNDNANSLALSMSQLPKDPITIELQVAAIFDSGQYASVRVNNPQGGLIVERVNQADTAHVPGWFIALFPIDSAPGVAQISTGWAQFGTVELVSRKQFAYQELWRGGIRLIWWFVGGGIAVGLFGMMVLQRIKRPLDAVVEQAQAISERRFVVIPEPPALELKSVVRAMNAMVGRLKVMFAEETARLEKVRREATQDGLTGVANRAYFMNQLDAALKDDDAAAFGSLLFVRLTDLVGINKRGGREAADDVLQKIGKALAEIAAQIHGGAPARLHGGDFALLLPGIADPGAFAEKLLTVMGDLVAAGLIDPGAVGYIASGTYQRGDSPGHLLAHLDATLASAEGQGALAWVRAELNQETPANSHAEWKVLLETAIQRQRVRLVDFPVCGKEGQLLHMECPLRLQATENGEWLTAGSFMPMASRLAMTSALDLAATRLALARIADGALAVAVNISGESIVDPLFRSRIYALVAPHKKIASRLWLEVSEVGAFRHLTEFRAFCDSLRPLGCRLGIEHFGRQFSDIGQIHDFGLDYIKVDGSFIRAIHEEQGNQTFLKGLCGIAHNIGLTVIAESVENADELAVLPVLGFDGATGPAVSRM